MAKRYAIWDKKTPVITLAGEYLTPEQWIARYPALALDFIIGVCDASEVNGAYFNILNHMVPEYEALGADFSACVTAEDKLAVIEAFEDAMKALSTEPTAEERQAAALEAIADGQTTENAAAVNALLNGEG